MSWEAVNQILSLALIDPDFAQELLADPLKVTQCDGDFQLTDRERQVISHIKAKDIAQFSQLIMRQLASELNEDP